MNTFLRAPVVETSSAPNQGPANPSQRILLVEDDAPVRQMSARMILNFGYTVDTAEDGAAGWEALQVGNYDLLLTDHNMPKVTGVELVQKMWSAHMTLPVILMSGALPTEELERHPWLKFTAILSKPFSWEKLLATMKEALSAPDENLNQAGVPVPFPTADRHQFMQPRHWGINESARRLQMPTSKPCADSRDKLPRVNHPRAVRR